MADDRSTDRQLVAIEHIESAIRIVRDHKVILDSTLAALYEVKVKILNQAVRRNIERFPRDFMLQPTDEEAASWPTSKISALCLHRAGGGHAFERLA